MLTAHYNPIVRCNHGVHSAPSLHFSLCLAHAQLYSYVRAPLPPPCAKWSVIVMLWGAVRVITPPRLCIYAPLPFRWLQNRRNRQKKFASIKQPLPSHSSNTHKHTHTHHCKLKIFLILTCAAFAIHLYFPLYFLDLSYFSNLFFSNPCIFLSTTIFFPHPSL